MTWDGFEDTTFPLQYLVQTWDSTPTSFPFKTFLAVLPGDPTGGPAWEVRTGK
jgi:hypothetical protein